MKNLKINVRPKITYYHPQISFQNIIPEDMKKSKKITAAIGRKGSIFSLLFSIFLSCSHLCCPNQVTNPSGKWLVVFLVLLQRNPLAAMKKLPSRLLRGKTLLLSRTDPKKVFFSFFFFLFSIYSVFLSYALWLLLIAQTSAYTDRDFTSWS